MALLGLLILKERLRWEQVLGIVLATFGVLLVVTKGKLSTLANGQFGTTGDILVLISAVNWAVFSALSRPGLQRHHATHMMFYIMTFGWLFTSILFIATPNLKPIHEIPLNGWLAISFLGIFCSGIAYIFWYDALQALPVAQTGAFLYIEPIITVIVAAVVLNERLLPATILGGITILVGVWMVNRTKSAPLQTEADI
jgi:drug/metabolite transporter (DMT)-like permease